MTGLGAASPLRISAAAHKLLDVLVSLLETTEINGRPWEPPKRVGFVPGAQLAYDDDQLTVNWLTAPLGKPGAEVTSVIQPYQAMYFYTFSVTLIRKVHTLTGSGPQGGTPTIAQLDGDATMVADEAALLLAAVQTMQSEELIVPINVPFRFGPLTAVGPEGGLCGSRIAVEFQAGVTDDY